MSLAFALCLAWAGGDDAAADIPSFRHEIVPLFTRLGCSSGTCHGKESGQGGFKLSLRGFAPEMDHEKLVVETRGRRVNLAAPEHSLFLLKATGRVPHRGGALVEVGSTSHRRLVQWVAAGAPGLRDDDPSLASLEVLGGGRVLARGQSERLQVRARFSDGTVRDVTPLSQFFANDRTVVEAGPDGRVKALREGSTAVRAHYQDKVAVAVFTIPHAREVDPARFAAPAHEVDRHVFARLAAMRIPPSAPCDDATFVRRIYLDLIGTLPTPAEAVAFVDDPAPDKRERLVEALFKRPEFVDFWALQLGDLLQNRKERDHDVRGSKGVRQFHAWLREQVAANRPWDQLARDVLLATGDSFEKPQIGYFVVTVGESREAEKSDVVVSVAQSFLGTRIVCAKCHNHPDERYTQDDYYHFAAFFSRVALDREKPDKGPTALRVLSSEEAQHLRRAREIEKQLEKAKPEEIERKRKERDQALKQAEAARLKAVKIVQPRTGRALDPQPLDRSAVTVAPGQDPRRALVDWMTSPDNEYFTGNMVNRLWKHFMGAGLVEPVDDLRPSNLPSNPDLWAHLRREFARSGFDLRHVMRLIVTSRAYQLSSETTAENADDRRYHSHYYARRLSAEVLLDAISAATGVPDTFPGYPVGVRATQLPDPGLDSYFLELF
ncbi:MAG TPA: DUF1549 domain-containing protein, partial [Planctomycetota bacterium]|nr:DUF1549 domain-containing protein [Planctomycetota bacterium]